MLRLIRIQLDCKVKTSPAVQYIFHRGRNGRNYLVRSLPLRRSAGPRSAFYPRPVNLHAIQLLKNGEKHDHQLTTRNRIQDGKEKKL